jgi:phosphatase NudJ
MSGRTGQPSWFFALVVVRHEGRFLIVHERKFGQTWYFPGGRVDPGESLMEGAIRETKEESGLDVELTGILRIEHTSAPHGVRVRATFLARPKPGASIEPRTEPNEHTLGAKWITMAELKDYPLRGEEVRTVFEYVEHGGPVAPLSLLTLEDAPWPVSR